MQFEALNTTDINITSKTAIFGYKLAKLAENKGKSHISVMIYHQRLISPSVSPILMHKFVSVFNKLKYLTMLATVPPPKIDKKKWYGWKWRKILYFANSDFDPFCLQDHLKKVLIYSYKPAKTAKVFGNSLDILPSVNHHKSSQLLNPARTHPFSPYSEVSKSLAYDVTSKISQGWKLEESINASSTSTIMSYVRGRLLFHSMFLGIC